MKISKKISIIVITMFIFNSCDFSIDYGKNRTKESEISGIVVKKYRHSVIHDTPCIDLNNNGSIGIEPWNRYTEFWEYIQIGDSVYKPSGSLNLKVIKSTGETKDFEYKKE